MWTKKILVTVEVEMAVAEDLRGGQRESAAKAAVERLVFRDAEDESRSSAKVWVEGYGWTIVSLTHAID